MNKWLKGIVLVIALVVAGYLYKKYRIAPDLKFSEIELTDIDGKNNYTLDDFSGKPVFLNFYTTWCKPCLKEFPSIVNASKELEKDGFIFLAVSDENPNKITKYQQRYNIDLNFLRLHHPMREDLEVHTIPTTYILNTKGEVVFTKVGEYEWDSPESIAMFRELVNE